MPHIDLYTYTSHNISDLRLCGSIICVCIYIHRELYLFYDHINT